MSQPSSSDQVSGPRKGCRAEAESIDELSSEYVPTSRRRRIGRQGRDSSNVGSRWLPGDEWDSDSFEECLMLRKQHHARHVVNSCGALLKGVEPKAEEGDSLQMVAKSLNDQSLVLPEASAISRQMLDEDVAVGAVGTESHVSSARSKALGQAKVAAPGPTLESNASTAEWLSAKTMVDEVVQRNQERAVAHADHCAASRPSQQPALRPALRPSVSLPVQRWQTVRPRLQNGGRQILAGVTRWARDISDSSRVRMAGVVPGEVSEIRGSRSAGPSQPLVAWDMEPMSLATSSTRDTSVVSNNSAGRQRAKRGSGVAAFRSQGANQSKAFSNLSLGRDRDGFTDSAEIDPDTLPNDLFGAP
mmetsp:Transcript_93764/g.244664  ORF Transcript_93764/g.244664 Transcript_93764/m.244664 type:complete len:360 (-) Transcript_93764:348-1427(-)